MSISPELNALLGAPRRDSRDEDSWGEVEHGFGVDIPDDFRVLLSGYGGILISGYLSVLSPDVISSYQRQLGETIAKVEGIPDPLLPALGGMFIWGSTVESDLLFLVQRAGGWRVAAWVRQWFEWYETDMPLGQWLAFARSEEQDILWLPEWEYPLEVGDFDGAVS